ncbi:hypothetical protein H8959_022366 [Pygathrix nigripes]
MHEHGTVLITLRVQECRLLCITQQPIRLLTPLFKGEMASQRFSASEENPELKLLGMMKMEWVLSHACRLREGKYRFR